MARSKEAIVTFKADESLLEALRRMPNRSAFIRTAIMQALESICPLCQGSGILAPDQRSHWETFAIHHPLQECGECHEWHLVCGHEGETADAPHQA